MATDKLIRITELLDDKGEIIVRNDAGSGKWFIHCFWNIPCTTIHMQYTSNLEETLDEIIEELGGNE